jgi:hypothetical protein
MIIPRVISRDFGSRLQARDACEFLDRVCQTACCKQPGSLTEFRIRFTSRLRRVHAERFIACNYPQLAIVTTANTVDHDYIGYVATPSEPGVPPALPHDQYAHTV